MANQVSTLGPAAPTSEPPPILEQNEVAEKVNVVAANATPGTTVLSENPSKEIEAKHITGEANKLAEEQKGKEDPKVEPPKAEEKKEDPKIEPPKIEEKKEDPKVEPPKVEPPKAEEKKEPPKVEPPKAEEKKEDPKVEPPKVEPPKAEEKKEPPKAEEKKVGDPSKGTPGKRNYALIASIIVGTIAVLITAFGALCLANIFPQVFLGGFAGSVGVTAAGVVFAITCGLAGYLSWKHGTLSNDPSKKDGGAGNQPEPVLKPV